MRTGKRNGLAALARFEVDNGQSRATFSCCGETRNEWATMNDDKSRIEARCPLCGAIHFYGVDVVRIADGGKPGSGRGAF